MKISQYLFLIAILLLGAIISSFAQTTWDYSATPDKNWSTFTNWSTDATPAATAVVFGATGITANATTVGNIVDTSYTGGNALTSLTYNANSASWQVTQINTPQTLTVNGAFLVGGLSGASQITKAAFTGTGSLVTNNSGAAITIANTGATSARSTLDMSALSTFTAAATSFNVGTGATGFGTVYLADTSTITATSINSGGSGSSYGSATSNFIYLGTTNTFNADTVALAGNRTLGTVKFRASGDGAANNTTVSGATLKIRAADGTSSASIMSVGGWTGGPGSSGGTSTVDLTGGSVDAVVTTLKIGATTNAFSSTATAILSLGAGTFNATTVIAGETVGNSTGTLTGTINVSGGTLTAGTVKLANNSSGNMNTRGTLSVSGTGGVTVNGDLTMGVRSGTGILTSTVNVSGGTLLISGGNIAEGTGAGVNISSAVNLSGGMMDLSNGNISVDALTLTGGTLKNVNALTVGTLAFGAGTYDTVTSTTVNTALNFSDALSGTFTSLGLVGDLTLGASSNLVLSLANGYTPGGIGSTFTLVNNDSIDAISGTFATINGGAFGGGNTFALTNDIGTYNYALSYTGGTGNDLLMTQVVPEPATLALLAFSLTTVVVLRRRRA